MTFDNPKHFKLDEEDGIAEWGALAPQNGVVHLGPAKQPYTVAMLHQLKCLDIIRRDMVAAEGGTSDVGHEGRYSGPSALGRHCVNYMRQMVMCHGDWELESFQFASHIKPIDWYGVYECMDWEAVYNAVRDNQKEYAAWLRNGGRAKS
ncbi:hypothetical protein CPC08DRAFT_634264 [Agrocybe pediades]|nr:hypothetical protein CPC08DRAFT_634264 [Agrocybe pediades]